jgi:hypothetical protein
MVQQQATKKGFTTDSQQVSALWTDFVKGGYVLVDWKSVGLPASLQYDAKYVYSRTFNYLLANDTASWTAK